MNKPIFSGLRFFNKPEISDSGPPAYYVLKKFIGLSRVWTREPSISRRARSPETSEADNLVIFRECSYVANLILKRIYLYPDPLDMQFKVWYFQLVLRDAALLRYQVGEEFLNNLWDPCQRNEEVITFRKTKSDWGIVLMISQPRSSQAYLQGDMKPTVGGSSCWLSMGCWAK